MSPAQEALWKQVSLIHEQLQFVGGQSLSWFAWGVALNMAAVYAYFSDTKRRITRRVVYGLIFGDVQAAIICGILICYYRYASDQLDTLIARLSVMAGQEELLTNTTPATFPEILWLLAAGAMCLLFLVITALWVYGLRKGVFNSSPVSGKVTA